MRKLSLAAAVAVAVACGNSDLGPPGGSVASCGYRMLSPVPTTALFVPGEVVVGFAEVVSLGEARDYLRGLGLPLSDSGDPSHWERGLRALVACVEPGDEEEWAERLSSAGGPVEYAHTNTIGWIQGGG